MVKVVEEWRDIPGYEGLYKIDITTKECRCYSVKSKRFLSDQFSKNDRRNYWGLFKDGKQERQQAARWVAITYPELSENEYFEGAEIDHKDTDRLNNQPTNLRWVTSKGNANNPLTRKHFLETVKYGKDHPKFGKKLEDKTKQKLSSKMTNHPSLSKEVEQYSKDGTLLSSYPSTHQAARETGVVTVSIINCCNGKVKTAGGYVWRYKEKEAV